MLSADQQKTRSRGIGGSEIAAVAGVDPYKSPYDVWASKLGADDFRETHHTERGKHIGPALVRWYAARTGRRVDYVGDDERTFTCPDQPIVIATPDGVVFPPGDGHPDAVVEAKAPGQQTYDKWGLPGTDEIPEQYIPQVIWEMAATGTARADVAAMIDGDLVIYSVAWDADLFDVLLEKAERFWRDHVLTRKAPPREVAAESEPLPRTTSPLIASIELDPSGDLDRWAGELRAYTEEAAASTRIAESIRAHIETAMGDHVGVSGDWGQIKWEGGKPKQVVDWKTLALEAGATKDQIENHTTAKPQSRRFVPRFK